jgi:hypothetical protein
MSERKPADILTELTDVYQRLGVLQNGHGHEPIGTLARDVAPERVSWLWRGRLALGKISLIDGDPGLGKSTAALDIAARVTDDRPLPGSGVASAARGVVVLSAEDGAADTIVPRLMAAGADLGRVFIMTGVRASDGTEEAVTVPGSLAAVERAITDLDAALLIVDPLMAYLGTDTNSNRDQDVRRALAPLAAMLERTACAGWLIRHLNKAQAVAALYRGGGSIGIIGAARFGLLVAADPDDADARILAPLKCNIGPSPPALRYRLIGVPGTDVARVEWDTESVSFDAAGLLAAAAGGDEDRSALQEAAEWLTDYLAGGPKPADDALRDSRKDGIAERTLRRAKSLVGVQSRRTDGDTAWRWHLPDTAKDGQPHNAGSLGNLGNVEKNTRNGAANPIHDGCQHGQDGQGCQHGHSLGNGHLDQESVIEMAKNLAGLSPDELSRYRQELATADSDDPDAALDHEARALFDAASATRATA